MAAPKGCCLGKCFIKGIIAIAVVVVIITVAGVVLLNQTPESLNIADRDFSGTTIRELGFADVKILDLIKALRDIVRPDEKAILTNQPTSADTANANQKFLDMGVPAQTGGAPDYIWLVNNPVYTAERQVLKVQDKDFAVIMNGMISQTENGDNEDAEALRDINGKVAQIIIASGKVEILIAIDKDSLDISDIPSFLVPNKLYINSVCTLKVNADGSLSTSPNSVSINGVDGSLSEKLLAAVMQKVNKDNDKTAKEFINEATGGLFVAIAGNIGEAGDSVANIGKASAVGSGYIHLVTREEV